jgi:hypothetical protein
MPADGTLQFWGCEMKVHDMGGSCSTHERGDSSSVGIHEEKKPCRGPGCGYESNVRMERGTPNKEGVDWM